ncbi:MAG: 4Fe-4S binding protein [Candidatus Andersenbacteria bacterium]|nr:4Fe-4S binding protein [Candidatus Andersenbacteria bacterium]MCK4591936.1 4Fe-4S binding protein [Candidatus Parcubacteria bacterium]
MTTKLKTAKQIPIGGKIIEAGNAKEFKTGSWKAKMPVRDKEKCINCMRCAVFCPDMAIKTKKVKVDGKEKVEVCDADMDYCKGCGICEVECPVKAIKMKDVC